MEHYLNVCDIKGSEVAPVDVITFGSPCQDLSLAGKRRGMHHSEMGDDDTTRSGLFMEAIRIIREMRESTQGKSPRYAVWENVYGALSSNEGADFQTVLTTLSNVKDSNIEIPMPLNNHWDSAGYVQGDSFSIAWRTLDAQYWGVPQRRRRIFMVADFDGNSAFDIMFNSEYDKSVVQGTNSYSDKDSTIVFDTYNIQLTGSVGKTLQVEGGGSGVNKGCMLVSPSNSSSICYGISSYDSNAFKSANPHSGIYVADTARTLDLNGGNPACNQGGICVCEPKPTENLYCVDQGGGKSGCNVTNQTAPTLTTTHQGEPVICEPTTSISHAQTLEPKAYGMSSCTFFHVEEEGAPTLMARDYKDPTLTCYKTTDPNHHYIVRRLTPLECCRLQGMPDGWTHPRW